MIFAKATRCASPPESSYTFDLVEYKIVLLYLILLLWSLSFLFV